MSVKKIAFFMAVVVEVGCYGMTSVGSCDLPDTMIMDFLEKEMLDPVATRREERMGCRNLHFA